MRAGAKAEPKARLGKRARPAAAQPALAEDLSRRGLRATRQRLALLRLLRAADGHPTALDLYRTLCWKRANRLGAEGRHEPHLGRRDRTAQA